MTRPVRISGEHLGQFFKGADLSTACRLVQQTDPSVSLKNDIKPSELNLNLCVLHPDLPVAVAQIACFLDNLASIYRSEPLLELVHARGAVQDSFMDFYYPIPAATFGNKDVAMWFTFRTNEKVPQPDARAMSQVLARLAALVLADATAALAAHRTRRQLQLPPTWPPSDVFGPAAG
jgi:hypothetical protein